MRILADPRPSGKGLRTPGLCRTPTHPAIALCHSAATSATIDPPGPWDPWLGVAGGYV